MTRLEFFRPHELDLVSGSFDDLVESLPASLSNTFTTLFECRTSPGETSYYLFEPEDLHALGALTHDTELIQRVVLSHRSLDVMEALEGATSEGVLLSGLELQGILVDTDDTRARPRLIRGWEPADPGTPVEADAEEEGGPGREDTFRRTPHLAAPTLAAADRGTTGRGHRLAGPAPDGRGRVRPGRRRGHGGGRRGGRARQSLVASEHFEPLQQAHRTMTIRRGIAESTPVTFRLRIAKHPPQRPAGLLALFTHHGRPCGNVSIAWDWDTTGKTADRLPGHLSASSLPVHAGAESPDLSVYITAPCGDDGMHYVCGVRTPLLTPYDRTVSEPYNLPIRAAEPRQAGYEPLFDERLSAQDRRLRLKELGIKLWKASPPHFQRVFWELIDSGQQPRSIFIASQ